MTTTTEVSSSSTTYLTIMNLSITPRSATSKVFLSAAIQMLTSGTAECAIRVLRDGTEIFKTERFYGIASQRQSVNPVVYLDTPSTISPVHYAIQGNRQIGTGFCAYSYDDVNGDGVSSMVLLEFPG